MNVSDKFCRQMSSNETMGMEISTILTISEFLMCEVLMRKKSGL